MSRALHTVGIIQARMGSSRLPGKVLLDLAGRPMLAQQLRRLLRSTVLDEIVVATTWKSEDDPIQQLANSEGLRCWRGHEHDVLARYQDAARESSADIVVRITADCPLIDATVLDGVVEELKVRPCDYVSNTLRRTYPRGLDVEAFRRDVLERCCRLAKSSAAREHVTHFVVVERPDLFITESFEDIADNSDLRWTVDTPSDLQLVRRLYHDLALGEQEMPYPSIVDYVRRHPPLTEMNRDVEQKTT